MGCENCTQKIKEQIEHQQQTYKQAQALAQVEKEWIAICVGDNGEDRFVRADQLQPGDVVKQYVSYDMRNA